MNVVIVDEATKAKLLAAGPGAEVRDESGNLIGQLGEEITELYDSTGKLVCRFKPGRTEKS